MEINWDKDYQGEFICPHCETIGMIRRGFAKFNCKRKFLCKNCKKITIESIDLTRENTSRFSDKDIPIIEFNWEKDIWDLRAINPQINLRRNQFNINFSFILQKWFKEEVKKYVYHLCKAERSYSSIDKHFRVLKKLSLYLNKTNIINFQQINRSVILGYLSEETKVTKEKLGPLRNFFLVGSQKDWFNVDQDIIQDEDYSKTNRGNPEPLSDKVREQIEQNLHKLPDTIARMWIICFFAAMRPDELALLKQDCLVQEGEHWKLVWSRKKNDDYHEVPISRTIAKVVQEQIEYIQDLWGNEWEYLFCHYHGVSRISLSKIKLKPLKKVIPSERKNPFLIGIRTLIKDLDIRDENDQPAQFQIKRLRHTRLTQLFEQGHDLAVVSAWAGHKHFATTSTYYTKVSCELIEKEAGHIQKALVNSEGHRVPYESMPKSFWETPQAHKLELSGTHINTPIYGYCGLSLDEDCHKFRACYTCNCFYAPSEKLPQYIKIRDELRAKESQARANGQDVLVEQFGEQANHLDKIITSIQGEAA